MVQNWIWYALTKGKVLQRDDEITMMFVSRSSHGILLLSFLGFLFLLHLLFSRHWTQSPILGWTKKIRLGSSLVTWEDEQESRHARLARVCQENEGRTKQVVDPDRYFHFLFLTGTSISLVVKVLVRAAQQCSLVWCGQGWIHHLCQVSLKIILLIQSLILWNWRIW